QNQPEKRYESPAARLTRPLQPQQRKRQAALDGVLRFALGHGKKRAARSAVPGDAPRIDARERMFQVRGNRKLLDRLIRESFGQDAPQLFAKILAGNLLRAALEVSPNNFHALRSRPPKAFHGQHEALIRLVRDRQDPPSEIAILRPKV